MPSSSRTTTSTGRQLQRQDVHASTNVEQRFNAVCSSKLLGRRPQ
jgi:hypothetical protein